MRTLKAFMVIVTIAIGLMAAAAPAVAQTCPIDRLITTGSCW